MQILGVPYQLTNPINLAGALAVAAMDRIDDACRSALGHGGETASALVAIGHQPGLSNDSLGRVLGLSHPGTVRLVDRLVTAGLVERRQAADRRAVSLHLTEAGEERRSALLARRDAMLESLLEPLTKAERVTFGRLLAKILRAQAQLPLQGLAICRLCNERTCCNCPVDAGVNEATKATSQSG